MQVSPHGNWSDRITFLVGGGPSLAGFEFKRLQGAGRVVGINRGMWDAPADIGVTMDRPFIGHNVEALTKYAAVHPLYIGENALPHIDGAIYEPMDTSRFCTSGALALVLAIKHGAKSVVLLGYDYQNFNGRVHYYTNDYPWQRNDSPWPMWAKQYEHIALECEQLGIEVFNASPQSAITVFPRGHIDEVVPC